MLVDDDRDALEPLRIALVDAGLDVVVFTDPLDALAHATQRWNLIVSDVDMPGLSGPELISQMIALPSGSLAIAVTSDPTPQVRERCRAAGALFCMQKRLAPVILRAIVPPWLARGTALREPVDVREWVDESLHEQMQRTFAEELPRRMAAIRTAADAGDADGLARTVHEMAAPAEMVGLIGLAALCRETQQQARGGVIPPDLIEAVQALAACIGDYDVVTDATRGAACIV